MENVDDIDFYNISDDGDFGYFVEVDLKYPETLYDVHKDLPFCAEHMATTHGDLYKKADLHRIGSSGHVKNVSAQIPP